MKCFVCKKEIKNDELTAILISGDGDFACSEKCKKQYQNDERMFFDNIDNDEFIKNYLTF